MTLTLLCAFQVIADVADLKAAIAEFKETIFTSKEKQKQAKDDIKRLEKDMDDFKKNKDSKLNELKVRLPRVCFPPCWSVVDSISVLDFSGRNRLPAQSFVEADGERQGCPKGPADCAYGARASGRGGRVCDDGASRG